MYALALLQVAILHILSISFCWANKPVFDNSITTRSEETTISQFSNELVDICGDWCDVKIPSNSHYGFNSPIDPDRWIEAQRLASLGGHELLKRLLSHVSRSNDFLDGDVSFRFIHHYVDLFLDRETGFSPLTTEPKKGSAKYLRHDPYSPEHRAPVVMAGYGMDWNILHACFDV